MTIKSALSYFYFLIEKGMIKKTEKSIEAINTISEFVEQKHNEDFNNNSLLAKLYVVYYGELLKYYEATVFDKIPQKELHKELQKSFEQIVEEFIEKHQNIETSLSIPKEHRDKHPRELKRLGIELKEAKKMDFQEAQQNLISTINLALNQYQ